VGTINKGIAKLRKYYPKDRWVSPNSRNKALYISLILDPRIKIEDLVVGITRYGTVHSMGFVIVVGIWLLE
jgi:hypothetical protein